MFFFFFFFFFNDTATTEIYTLSLHDALPIPRSRYLSRSKACSLRAAFCLIAPVSTVWITPGSRDTAASASRAPRSARPCLTSRSLRAPNAAASSVAYLASRSFASAWTARPAAPGTASFSASDSKKISESLAPASCGRATSGRPVTRLNASAYASLDTLATSTRVRSMFHRTRRWMMSLRCMIWSAQARWPISRKVLQRALTHVRIAIVGRRGEQLLDRAGIDPSGQVEQRTGLVVGAAGPGPAERLLTDDRAGGLVVDVEVTRREPQRIRRGRDRGAVGGDDGAGQRVPGDVGRLRDHRVVVGVVEDVHGQDRPEVLGREHLVCRV